MLNESQSPLVFRRRFRQQGFGCCRWFGGSQSPREQTITFTPSGNFKVALVTQMLSLT
jgi:hypothetical protein